MTPEEDKSMVAVGMALVGISGFLMGIFIHYLISGA